MRITKREQVDITTDTVYGYVRDGKADIYVKDYVLKKNTIDVAYIRQFIRDLKEVADYLNIPGL